MEPVPPPPVELFVRPLGPAETTALEAGLRSRDAFTLRRCQILLASARGRAPDRIAGAPGCASSSVRNAIRASARQVVLVCAGLVAGLDGGPGAGASSGG